MDKTIQSEDSLELSSKKGQSVSRRNLLKTGSAVVAGTAIGSNAITGFPTIWAQNIKNVTLRQFGTGVSISTKSQSVPNKTLVLLCR